ncbi:Wadjet anti-phage system protein JetD domain-containing protein [Pseudomonas putida]|uniref:Wadjet anti-phage system protein JetD domain-containing protein n=1 Tax=Pseudomonas putida TaxID=303 RepID=UPI0039062DD0
MDRLRCLHLLRELPGTIAVLGCGSDLAWLGSEQLQSKQIAYWGDIDTWGLRMLARARARQKDVTALMMTESVFDDHADSAVPEPVRAQDIPPDGLLPPEAALFLRLVHSKKGRLEQEFIPREEVRAALDNWLAGQGR